MSAQIPVTDACGAHITFYMIARAWAEIAPSDTAPQPIEIDWTDVVIRTHPIQKAHMNAFLPSMKGEGGDVFHTFEKFLENAKWMVDENYERGEMEIYWFEPTGQTFGRTVKIVNLYHDRMISKING